MKSKDPAQAKSRPTRLRRTLARLAVLAAVVPSAVALAPAGVAQAGTGADNEVSWAQSQQATNPAGYDGACLAFVGDAANAAGIDFRSQIDTPIGGDTYPDDLLGHFAGGTWGTDATPPRGSWVFWSSTTGDRTLSHVALSLGDGTVVSTSDSVASGIHVESMGDHAYATYDGYWLPSGA
jgi:cell wall-associated NlpC family hydrolase